MIRRLLDRFRYWLWWEPLPKIEPCTPEMIAAIKANAPLNTALEMRPLPKPTGGTFTLYR